MADTIFANYANYVAQVLLAAETGSVPAIPNALASAELNTAILTDPVRIQAYRESIADQMNAQSAGPKFEDLSERVADIIINTNAQGAGTLEVHLIDPYWVLPVSGFIQADENGFLWPPIDINFPSGTDCVWRLCQYSGSWSSDATANLVLTGEDRIVSLLRELSPGNGGIQQGLPNQTLGGFIKMLVDSANKVLKPTPPIRLVEMISPVDPNYTVTVTQLPKSATSNITGRNNPNKTKQGLTNAQQNQLDAIQQSVSQLFGNTPGGLAGPVGGPLTLAEIEQGAAGILHGSGSTQVAGFGLAGNPILKTGGSP